jgi:Mg2+-importing ATPase
MFFWICPMVLGGSFGSLTEAGRGDFAALFHSGWFVVSMWTQTLVIHLLRTPKLPFIQSRASLPVVLCTSLGIAICTFIPYTSFGESLKMMPLPPVFFIMLGATVICYMALVTLLKGMFVRKYGELL